MQCQWALIKIYVKSPRARQGAYNPPPSTLSPTSIFKAYLNLFNPLLHAVDRSHERSRQEKCVNLMSIGTRKRLDTSVDLAWSYSEWQENKKLVFAQVILEVRNSAEGYVRMKRVSDGHIGGKENEKYTLERPKGLAKREWSPLSILWAS